jgi:hypothetical protein
MRGSSAIPQMGQKPGLFWRICECIGHVYIVPGFTASACATGFGAMYFCGSATNFARQPALQK